MFKFLVYALVVAAHGVALAQPQTFGEKVWWNSSANTFAAEVSKASGAAHPGVPFLQPLPARSGSVAMGRIEPVTGNWPDGRMRSRLPGAGVVIDVQARVVPPSAARAVARFAAKALPGISTVIALGELLDEISYKRNVDASGAVTFTKAGSGSCTVSASGFPDKTSTAGSCLGAAQATLTKLQAAGQFANWVSISSCEPNSCVTTNGYAFDAVQNPPSGTVTATITQLENDIASRSGWPSSSQIAPVIADAISSGELVEFETPRTTGASTSPGAVVTTVKPDGTTETKTTTNNYSYAGNTVTVTSTTITNNVNNTTGAVTTQSETVQPAPPPEPQITCGLPNTPACRIDETGMPDKPAVDAAMKKTPTEIQKDIDDITKNPAGFFPAFPTLNWAFALPTGCAQIPTPAFAPAMTQIDVCTFQPMFHDVMTVVWMLGGLFGAISLFMKNALAT